MLIQFQVGNFKSFKDKVSLSLVASSIREHKDTNVFSSSHKLRLLKSAVIYGANASGKSNLFKSLGFMKFFVENSFRETPQAILDIDNFKLSWENRNKPSFFEIIFDFDKTLYRYGFEISPTGIEREWLYFTPSTKEALLFERSKSGYKIGEYFKKESKDLQERTRQNTLFLSVVAQFNGEYSTKILKWFSRLVILQGYDEMGYKLYSLNKMLDETFKNKILKFTQIADSGIQNLNSEKVKISVDSFPGMPDDFKQMLIAQTGGEGIKTDAIHNVYDNAGKIVDTARFDFDSRESEGTRKLTYLSAPIMDILENGGVLVVDELDSRLHLFITRFVINLFNSKTNVKKSQLIFTTHNTSLLSNKLFRRDQIWFTEKNKTDSTNLTSLVEYKVRNDASFDKDYLTGKYGAVPSMLGDLPFEEN